MNRRLHITSGRGPQECCWVVFELVRQVLREARQCGLRAELRESVSWRKKNNSSIWLVFAPVFGVASTGTYNKYAPADAPWRPTQIRRHRVELFLSASLNPPSSCLPGVW